MSKTSALTALIRNWTGQAPPVILGRTGLRWESLKPPLAELTLRIAEILDETPTIRTFVFESAGGRLDYEAGQRLTLSVHAGGRVQKRCYSFSIATRCLAPGRQRPPRRDGAVSPVLHPLRTGDTLQAAPASGSFTLPSPSSGEHCYVLVGGGVGLTPLISLAETALRRDR